MAPDTDSERIFEDLKVGQLVMLKGREETYFFQVSRHVECYPRIAEAKFVRCKTPGKRVDFETLDRDVACVGDDDGVSTARVLCPVDGSFLTECSYEGEETDGIISGLDFYYDVETNTVPSVVSMLYKDRLVCLVKDGEEVGLFKPVGHHGRQVQLEMCAYFGEEGPMPFTIRGFVEIGDAFTFISMGYVWAEQFSDARKVMVSEERIAADVDECDVSSENDGYDGSVDNGTCVVCGSPGPSGSYCEDCGSDSGAIYA